MRKKIIDYYVKNMNLENNVFQSDKNVFMESDKVTFHMISFGKSIIFIGRKDLINWAKDNFENTLSEDVLDGKNFYNIEGKLRESNLCLGGEYLRFLYMDSKPIKCPKNVKLKKYNKEEIGDFYLKYPGFENALNYEEDEIAIAAFIDGKIAAVAGADKFKDPLWQIGIDTVKDYRGGGLGKLLTYKLAKDILSMGKIPYYTTWSGNIASMRTAIAVGFYPVWVEYFAEELKSK